jgi:hypothetical protein
VIQIGIVISITQIISIARQYLQVAPTSDDADFIDWFAKAIFITVYGLPHYLAIGLKLA